MSTLLKHALDRAAVWHRDQRRKYPDADVPYMSHCAGVAIVLARHGFDEEVVAAGALHDVLEDTAATEDDLIAEFGPRVAELVRLCSEEDKSLSWEERKLAYLERFPGKPWDAQAITLADKIDNFRSILVCAERHGDPWPMFKRGRDAQLARFAALAVLLGDLPEHPLIDEYQAALAQLRRV
ncbi:MAG: HD domain-containing protein [Nannocystaceae bacterium]